MALPRGIKKSDALPLAFVIVIHCFTSGVFGMSAYTMIHPDEISFVENWMSPLIAWIAYPGLTYLVIIFYRRRDLERTLFAKSKKELKKEAAMQKEIEERINELKGTLYEEREPLCLTTKEWYAPR